MLASKKETFTPRILTLFLLLTMSPTRAQEKTSPSPEEAPTEQQDSASIENAPLRHLPLGEVAAEFVSPVAPPRMMNRFNTFTKALKSKPSWWNKFRAEHLNLPKATPYPYHSNMGLSEIEYSELAEFSKSSWVWSPISQQKLILVGNDATKIRIVAEDQLAAWNSLTFHPSTADVSFAGKKFTPQPEENQTIKIGPFTGFRVHSWTWKDHEGQITENGSAFVVSIMAAPNRSHLYLQLQKVTAAGGGIATNHSDFFRIPARSQKK